MVSFFYVTTGMFVMTLFSFTKKGFVIEDLGTLSSSPSVVVVPSFRFSQSGGSFFVFTVLGVSSVVPLLLVARGWRGQASFCMTALL